MLFIEMEPDPRSCTPGTPGVCHLDATCTPVTPYVCSSTRPMSYRCECNQGYTGDGLSCEGELKLSAVTVSITGTRSFIHSSQVKSSQVAFNKIQ